VVLVALVVGISSEAQASGLVECLATPGGLEAPVDRVRYCLVDTPRRIRLSEQVAERSARKWAADQGWTAVFDGRAKGLPQGIDQVHRLPDGRVAALEVKGGSSVVKSGYGALQGTLKHAVGAAVRMLLSPSSSPSQKVAAVQTLVAALSGELVTVVVRVPHRAGVPGAPVLEALETSATRCTSLAGTLPRLPQYYGRLKILLDSPTGRFVKVVVRRIPWGRVVAVAASTTAVAYAGLPWLLERLSHRPVLLEASSVPVATGAVGAAGGGAATVLGRIARGGLRMAGNVMVAALVAVSVVDIEKRHEQGELTDAQRELEHARNVGGWAGGLAGGYAGGKLGALVGSKFGPIGSAIGGIAGGLAGFIAGEEAVDSATTAMVTSVQDACGTVSEAAVGAAVWAGDQLSAGGEAVGDAVAGARDAVVGVVCDGLAWALH
jgi:hypothetical protein